jgi:hypothetical protein
VRDTPEEHDNARILVTEWLFDGEVVRRDAWVNVLRAQVAGVESP